MRPIVDFLIIGAARSGTSSIHNILFNHKCIYLPSEPPEPNFFFKDSEYKKGIDYYHKRYFANIKKNLLVGEKSTSYFYNSQIVSQRIFKYNKNIKLILILRNPIDRVISNYFFSRKNNIELMSFSYAIRNELVRKQNYTDKWIEIKPYDYIGRSKYFEELSHYFKYFEKSQILTLLYDDYKLNQLCEINKICKFLGVEEFSNMSYDIINSNNISYDISIDDYNYLKEILHDDVKNLSMLLNQDLLKLWRF